MSRMLRISRLTKTSSGLSTFVLALVLVSAISNLVDAQPRTSGSPARRTTVNGTMQATRSQFIPSAPQAADSMVLRWSSSRIAGDVHPLIANIINDSVIPGNTYAPQEIVAIIGGELIALDAKGRVARSTKVPPFVKSVSAIFDDTQLPASVSAKYSALIGLETIERRDTVDSLAVGYIAAIDSTSDSLSIVKRLTIDVAPFAPNLMASIRPFFAQANGNLVSTFCTVDMSAPSIDTSRPIPFFRGMTIFDLDLLSPKAQVNVNDTVINQFKVAPYVSSAQPAITAIAPNLYQAFLPCFPDTISTSIPYMFRSSDSTVANKAYIIGATLSNPVSAGVAPLEFRPDTVSTPPSRRPRISPSFVDLTDAATGVQRTYALVAEEYVGRAGSQGRSRLHLYDSFGRAVTIPGDTAVPPFAGGRNHAWSVGAGNLDGDTSNVNLPFYPHNPGNEIVVTQSSPELAFAGSRLMVLRYRSGVRIQKETKRTDYLFMLDTIVTQAIPGWLACVTDIDSAADAKAEVVVVDGGTFSVYRLRDYSDQRFMQSDAFDTVFTYTFAGENINDLSVVDVDGDGLNEIVVTTNMSCNMFGQPARNTLLLTSPSRSSSSVRLCEGDTIGIHWKNIYPTTSTVSISFRPYLDDVTSIASRTVIASNLTNTADTGRYVFVPDTSYAGKQGRFFAEAVGVVGALDSSAMVYFSKSMVDIDSTIVPSALASNESVVLRGMYRCVDSLTLWYAVDTSSTWTKQNAVFVPRSDSTFAVDFVAPCLTFGLNSPASVGVRMRVDARNAVTGRTTQSNIVRTSVTPASVALTVERMQDTLCADRKVLWHLPPGGTVDTVVVAVSSDGGQTYITERRFPSGENSYEYKPLKNAPDSVMIRVWRPGTCYRSDTTLRNTSPRLVRTIVPNPFEPGIDVVGIYTSQTQSGNVSMRIYDEREDLVKEIVIDQSREKNKVYCDYWDGTTVNGDRVSAGMYYLLVSYNDGSSEYYPIYARRK